MITSRVKAQHRPPLAITRLRCVLAAGLCLAGCSHETPKPDPVEVGVVRLAAHPFTLSAELTGRTAATTSSDVRPQVDGIVRKRLFQEGTVVRAGQPLYQIDPRLFRASRDQAAAQFENAQAVLAIDVARADRYKTLDDSQAVSRQDIDDALAAVRQARASVHQYRATLAAAQVNLEYTLVSAPISGRIGRSTVTPGALVTAGQAAPMASIQQLDPIYVDVTQSSSQLLQLRRSLAKGAVLPANATVHLKFDDGTDYPLPGVLEFAETTVDADAGTVTLRARFPNPDGLLLPGMFVRVEAPQAIVPQAILAPQQGISRDARGHTTALVVEAGDKVALRPVSADRAIGNQWLVTGGLKPGDRLIVEGSDKVSVGARVKPVAVRLEH